MTYFLPNFDNYDNPRKAMAVWSAYLKDLERHGMEDQASDIVAECSQIRDLDIQLDTLISERENRLSRRH